MKQNLAIMGVAALLVTGTAVGIVARGAGLPGQSPSLPGLVVPDGLGVNIHFTDPAPGEMAMLTAGGFRWVRMDYSWEGIEREPGRYDFSAYDRLMSVLEPNHIRPVFILDYSNAHYDGGLSPHTDAGRAAFARWAAASVRHFHGRGIVWEMYNEPNISFWKPVPAVAEYAKLALAVGKAIRGAEPDELYVGPAMSTMDLPFLEACFKAGALNYWDAVTVHPYRSNLPETAAFDYRKLRLLIARYAPHRKRIPILSGEWGYTELTPGLNIERQGKFLARQWLTNLSNDVPVSIWYDWHDDGTDPKEGEHHFGTVRNAYFPGREPVYDPKPAYLAAQTLTRQLRGFRMNKSLAVGVPGDHALLFTRGADVRLVVWSESSRRHWVRIPASAGAFRQVSWTGQNLGLLQADLQGLRVELGDAPIYLRPDRSDDVLRVAAAWKRLPLEVSSDRRPIAVSVGLANPLGRAIDCSVVEEGRRAVGRPIRLGPRAGLTASVNLPPTLEIDPSVHRITLSVRLDGRTYLLSQETFVAASHPLGVAAQLAGPAQVRVVVRNPSGARFDGALVVTIPNPSSHLRRHGVRPIHPGHVVQENRSERRAIHLAAGRQEMVVRVSVPPAGAGGLRLDATLVDGVGARVSQLIGARFVPVDVCRLRADGTTPRDLIAVPDGKPGVLGECTLVSGPSPSPSDAPISTAMRLRYRTGKGERFFRVEIAPESRRPLSGKPRSLGIWVRGDDNGNLNFIRMRFLDASGQQFQTLGERIKWRGWRYVSFPINAAEATHTGGDDDGIIHYPVRILAPLVMWNGYGRAVEGEIAFACPMVVY